MIGSRPGPEALGFGGGDSNAPAVGPGTWRREPPALPVILLVLLVLVSYHNSLRSGFVLDDHHLIEQNPYLSSWSDLPRVMSTDFAEFQGAAKGITHYYRPLTAATYVVEGVLWGKQPLAHHLSNVFWHLAAAVLYYLFLHRLLRRPWIAFSGASLWAVHPVTTESVAWISGRTDSIAAVFCLGSLLAFLSYLESGKTTRLFSSAALAYLAVLAKEVAAVTPILALAAWIVVAPSMPGCSRRCLAGFLALMLAVAVYALQREAVLGGMAWGAFPEGSQNAALRTFLKGTAYYAKIVAWPRGLVGEIHMRASGWDEPPTRFGAVLVLAALVLLVVFTIRRSPAGFAIGWVVATIAPAAGILIPAPIAVATRFLYLPLMGLTLGGALFFGAVFRRLRVPGSTRGAFLVVFLVLLAGLTRSRNRDYENDRTFCASVVRNAESAGFGVEAGYNTLVTYSIVLAYDGDLAGGEAMARRAIAQRPREGGGWNNLGIILAMQDDLAGAEPAWREAIEHDPSDALAPYNLGQALEQLGRYQEAMEAYRMALARGLSGEDRVRAEARLRAMDPAPEGGARRPSPVSPRGSSAGTD